MKWKVKNMGKDLRDDVLQKIKSKEFHCAKELTLSIISGKWKIVILYRLGIHGQCALVLFSNFSQKLLIKC